VTPYDIGAFLALCDTGLAKTASVAGLAEALATLAVADKGRALARRSLGLEPPSWRRVSPLDFAVSEAELLGRNLGLTEPAEPVTTTPPLASSSDPGLVSETAPAPLPNTVGEAPALAVAPATLATPAATLPEDQAMRAASTTS